LNTNLIAQLLPELSSKIGYENALHIFKLELQVDKTRNGDYN